jgi:hypothetical protein
MRKKSGGQDDCVLPTTLAKFKRYDKGLQPPSAFDAGAVAAAWQRQVGVGSRNLQSKNSFLIVIVS